MAEALLARPEQILRTRTSRFLSSRARGRRPLLEVLHRLSGEVEQAVLFGGVLRDIMLSTDIIRPRDVDIVVAGTEVSQLERSFRHELLRKTRFGGLCLNASGWRIDLWPLEETWAFRTKQKADVSFSALPETTFLNIEAVAVTLNTAHGKPRGLFESGFFDALRQRTLEINLEANPFPDLAIVRSLLLAAKLRFRLGERLVRYIAEHSERITLDALMAVQAKHYGNIRRQRSELGVWLNLLQRHHLENPEVPFFLPDTGGVQLGFWESLNWFQVGDLSCPWTKHYSSRLDDASQIATETYCDSQSLG